jgi:pimeloyl-ACP methyl ester carboxylesterase
MRRRTVLGGFGAILAAGALGTALRFRADVGRERVRVTGRSELIQSRAGKMEYAVAGDGPPILMLHGTGGGFDQGLAFTTRLAQAGWRIVAPSRFGYLRSDYPEDASSEAQADALVDLLDVLGIGKVPVAGGSAGALPALAFAIRHPDRCAALVPIVPATYVPGRAPAELTAVQAAIIGYALRSDFLFWAGMTLAEDRMIRTLLATDPALVHTASSDEQARVRGILRGILPVSARSRGLLQDGRLAGNPGPMDLAAIRAPTLAISVEDDLFGTADAARHIAAGVTGARSVIYPSGGHVWVGHDAEMMAGIDAFLRDVPGTRGA